MGLVLALMLQLVKLCIIGFAVATQGSKEAGRAKSLPQYCWKLVHFSLEHPSGVEVSTEDIKHAVNEVFEENKALILELRYRTNVGELLGHVRKRLPWADAKAVKAFELKLQEAIKQSEEEIQMHARELFKSIDSVSKYKEHVGSNISEMKRDLSEIATTVSDACRGSFSAQFGNIFDSPGS